MIQNDALETLFRKFSLDKLEALKLICDSALNVVTTTTVSGTLNFENKQTGGVLSALIRTKINDQPLIISSGRHGQDILWRFNEKAAPKDLVRDLVDEILEESQEYREEIDKK